MDNRAGATSPTPNTPDHKGNPDAWTEWLATPPGRYLLQWEGRQLACAVGNVFGYYAVQLGMPALDALADNRMPHRIRVLQGTRPVAEGEWQPDLRVADYGELPFASQSVDLVVMPHRLEDCTDPHQLLREVDRVLRPEGRLVVLGINPWSLWGLRQALPGWLGGGFLPHAGALIGAPHVRDWIRLLSFEPDDTVYGGYAWPFLRQEWLARSQRFLERAGDRWWPVCGAVYLVCAVKRVRGMRLVGPAWRGVPARHGAAVAMGGRGSSCRGPASMSAEDKGSRLSRTPEGAAVELVSDSQYVLKGLSEWRAGWERRGFRNAKGDPVANLELWKRLFAVADARKVSVRWVRGHQGNVNNERADRLAVAALQKARGGA